jgi:LacI family transcriptional regulator
MEQLRAAHVWGVAIDSINANLMKLVRDNGLAALMVDAWREDAEIDTVVQDSHQGGLLAANYLISRGHRRIGWAGAPPGESSHSLSRFGGAAAGLARSGLAIPPELCCDARRAEGFDKARELLTRKDRPTAILALWGEACQNVVRAARELKLVLGRDFDVVGWSTEEQYASTYRPGFPDGQVPPAIVWSVAAMAELAVTRLAQRQADPSLLVAKINVPVKLRAGTE